MVKYEYEFVWEDLHEEDVQRRGENGWELVKYGMPNIFKRKISIRQFQYKKITEDGYFVDLSINNLNIEGENGWELCGINETDIGGGKVEKNYIFRKEI